jgi:hypothetical protein
MNRKALCAIFACFCFTVACSRPVAVHEARWENRLSGPGSPVAGATYVANPGYTFLVVDVDLNLGKSTPVASGDFTLVSDGGKSFPAVGIRLPEGDYMMGGFSGLAGKVDSVGLIFSVPDEEKGRTFHLKFKDGSPILVSVKSGS